MYEDIAPKKRLFSFHTIKRIKDEHALGKIRNDAIDALNEYLTEVLIDLLKKTRMAVDYQNHKIIRKEDVEMVINIMKKRQ